MVLVERELKNAYIGEPGWEPGANTIAYYPLTSTTTVNDMSGNSHTLSKSGTATYDNIGVYLPKGANYLTCRDTAVSTIPTTYTVCCWIKRYSSSTIPVFGVMKYPSGGSFAGYNLTQNEVSGVYRIEFCSTNGTSANSYSGGDDNWHLWTMSLSGGTATFCLDDVAICTATTSNSYAQAMELKINQIRGETNRGGAYYSELILENKARTAQEVSDYYNQTKANYGL